MNYTWFYIRILCRIQFWRENTKTIFVGELYSHLYILYINPYTKKGRNQPNCSIFQRKKNVTFERGKQSCWFFLSKQRTKIASFDNRIGSLECIFQKLRFFHNLNNYHAKLYFYKKMKKIEFGYLKNRVFVWIYT